MNPPFPSPFSRHRQRLTAPRARPFHEDWGHHLRVERPQRCADGAPRAGARGGFPQTRARRRRGASHGVHTRPGVDWCASSPILPHPPRYQLLFGPTLVLLPPDLRASADASIVDLTATVVDSTATVNEPPQLARQTKVQQYDRTREGSVLKSSVVAKPLPVSCLANQEPCSHGTATQWPPPLPAVNIIARA
eukprot:361912-Chlamydomonas_euryale.AAC.2